MISPSALIVSCPCALGLATPLAVAAGTQAGLRRRIVVKHAGAFERAADLGMVVFDKTGTLTTGKMQVVDAVGDPDALAQARAIEQWSSHPVGRAVADSGARSDAEVHDVETHPRGIMATVDGHRMFVGHPEAYRARGGTIPASPAARVETAVENAQVPVVVGWGGEARGLFVVGDSLRQNLGWAFGYNAVAIPLAILGWLNPLAAALAMASSSLLVVGNSARRLDG